MARTTLRSSLRALRLAGLAALAPVLALAAEPASLADIRAGAADGRFRLEIECAGRCSGALDGDVVSITGLAIGRALRTRSGAVSVLISPAEGGARVAIDAARISDVETVPIAGGAVVRVFGVLGAVPSPASETIPVAARRDDKTKRPSPATDDPAPAATPARRIAEGARLREPAASPEAEAPADAAEPYVLRIDPALADGGPGDRFRAALAEQPAPRLTAEACAAARARLAADGWAIDALVHAAYCDAAEGRAREAMEAFERTLVYDPQDVLALYGRAAVAAVRGDRDAARRWYDGARAAEAARGLPAGVEARG